jgi:hypothetical protein
MKKGWDIGTDRLLKYSQMPAKKKLEWLTEMHELMRRSYSEERKRIFWKLRGIK